MPCRALGLVMALENMHRICPSPGVLGEDFLPCFFWEKMVVQKYIDELGGGNSNIFYFQPLPGEMIHFDEHILQMG